MTVYSLTVDDARQVMGSAERLQAMRKGAKLNDVISAGRDSQYHYEAAISEAEVWGVDLEEIGLYGFDTNKLLKKQAA